MSRIDLQRARDETPGCDHVLHFNNAGAALMPRPVLATVVAHLELEAMIGGYEAAERADGAINRTYEAIATLIGCEPDEIAVVENATRAWDMAFYSLRFRPGDRILTAASEYASNVIAFLQVAQQSGASVEVIPNDEMGQLSVAALREMIDDRVRLIAVSHIPTNGGLVNPAAAIGRVAREAGVLYLLDACQSVGQLPIDVGEIGCDMLSATSRKYLRGPRGVGFLYVRRDLIPGLEPPFLDLHAATWTAPDQYEIRADARRFENWESNVAAKIGLGAAVDYALGWGLPAIWERITLLADLLRCGLEEIPGVTVRDLGQVKAGLVSFTVEGCDPEALRLALAADGINVSTTTVASTRFEMTARDLEGIVRASVHYYNSEAEVERFCQVLKSLILV